MANEVQDTDIDPVTGKLRTVELHPNSIVQMGLNTNLVRRIANEEITKRPSSSSGVQSVVAGTNVTVDNTDPANPIVSASGGAGSGITRTITSISSPATAGAAASVDYVYLVSGTTTLTLPTAVSNTNRYSVSNVGSNTVTVATTGGQTINGSSTATLPIANMSLDFVSNNSNWVVE